MDEFNEIAHYEKDLLSLKGFDDERSHVYDGKGHVESRTHEDVISMLREIIVFQFMYLCLEAQSRVIFLGIKPLICLDGFFLNIAIGGHLLCPIARDGNEKMLSLATAGVDAKCKESLDWFLNVLCEDFGRLKDNG